MQTLEVKPVLPDINASIFKASLCWKNEKR